MPGSGPGRLLSPVNYRPHTKHPNVFLRLCLCKLECLMIIMIIALCPGPGLCNPSCVTWLMRDGNCNINTINTAQTSGNNNIISAGQIRLIQHNLAIPEARAAWAFSWLIYWLIFPPLDGVGYQWLDICYI